MTFSAPAMAEKIRRDWPRVRLVELCNLVNGDPYRPTDWSLTGTPIIRIQNLNNATKSFNHWAGNLDDRVVVQPGNVLLAWSGTPGTSFGVHIWRGSIGVLNQHIFRVDFLDDSILPEWFVYAVNQQLAVLIAQAHGGVGLRHVKKGQVEALQIPLPPLTEQKRIVAILIEKLTAVEKARIATEAQVDSAEALLGAELRAIFSNSAWPMKALCEISALSSGGTPSRGNPGYFHGAIPWVKTLDLNCSVVTSTQEKISTEAFQAIRGELLPPGTVMVAMYGGAGTIGKSGILGIPATTNQAICAISPNLNFLCSEYLHAWLMWFRPQWMKSSGGNRKDPNINKGVVERMKVPVPPLLEQKRICRHIAAKIKAHALLIDALKQQAQSWEMLPTSILRRAFVGEL